MRALLLASALLLSVGSCACPAVACGALPESVLLYATDASTGRPLDALLQVQLLDGGRWQSYATWRCTDPRNESAPTVCSSVAAALLGTVSLSVSAPGFILQTLTANPGIVGEGQCGCPGPARTVELRVALQASRP